jgi:hypothetical protein
MQKTMSIAEFNRLASKINSLSPKTPSTQQPGAAVPAAVPPAPTTPQPEIEAGVGGLKEAIDELCEVLQKCAVQGLLWRIKTGVHLHQFRDCLGMSDWLELLRSGRLHFSARTAQTLARIGAHTTLANPKHASKLPDGMTILDQLAAVPPKDLEQLIARSEVCATTTLEQARQLAAQHRAKKTAAPDQPPKFTLI